MQNMIESIRREIGVQTAILPKTSKVPIYYRLMEQNQDWKIYDVVIGGVSLVNNCRRQIREILASKTLDALIETLRNKIGKGNASECPS
jgi:phospholipid transport system substrate-binding protein